MDLADPVYHAFAIWIVESAFMLFYVVINEYMCFTTNYQTDSNSNWVYCRYAGLATLLLWRRHWRNGLLFGAWLIYKIVFVFNLQLLCKTPVECFIKKTLLHCLTRIWTPALTFKTSANNPWPWELFHRLTHATKRVSTSLWPGTTSAHLVLYTWQYWSRPSHRSQGQSRALCITSVCGTLNRLLAIVVVFCVRRA